MTHQELAETFSRLRSEHGADIGICLAAVRAELRDYQVAMVERLSAIEARLQALEKRR
jgi:hypothetical protein